MAQKKVGRGRAVGIGGVFLRAKEPKKLAAWYKAHLGLPVSDGLVIFEWQTPGRPRRGQTVWSVVDDASSGWGRNRRPAMVNYRVDDLERLLTKLRRSGQPVDPRVEMGEYGKFGWVTDPAGNRIELWEPPRRRPGPAAPLVPME